MFLSPEDLQQRDAATLQDAIFQLESALRYIRLVASLPSDVHEEIHDRVHSTRILLLTFRETLTTK